MFGKWFTDTYEGSMMGAGPIILSVWPWVMAHAGATGELTINPRLVSAHIGITVDEARTAIAHLCSKDPESRSQKEGGARLVLVSGMTYQVVNHDKWRAARNAEERREYNRIKQREARERKRQQVSNNVNDTNLTVSTVSQRQKTETEDRRQKAELHPSELASEPTGNAHPHSAPTQPLDPAGTLPPTGKADAALGASSQASKAVSVAKRKPSKRKPSADAIRIAQHLYQAISAHSPDMFGADSPAATEKRLLGWTVEIDRGLKAKDITVEDALLIVDYAHHIDDPAGSNGFSWHTNLLSGVAMRKQWKKKALLGKARRWRDGVGQGQGALGGKQAASDFIENDDYDYAAAAERNRRMGIGI